MIFIEAAAASLRRISGTVAATIDRKFLKLLALIFVWYTEAATIKTQFDIHSPLWEKQNVAAVKPSV